MSNTLIRPTAMTTGFQPDLPQDVPERVAPVWQDRRRPGRAENVSPELIALMRRPTSTTGRVKVALYDAPGFLIPVSARPPRPGRTKAVMLAIIGSSLGWAAVFNAMMWAWG